MLKGYTKEHMSSIIIFNITTLADNLRKDFHDDPIWHGAITRNGVKRSKNVHTLKDGTIDIWWMINDS